MRLLISFCNLQVPGLALGLFDPVTESLEWIDLSGVGESCYGVTGLCRRADGFWMLLQLAPGGRSGLARLDDDGRLQGVWTLSQTGDAHHIIPFREGFLVTDTQRNRLNYVSLAADGSLTEAEFWRGHEADSDVVHLNSVIEFDGDVFVSVFGPRPPGKWADVGAGKIVNVTQALTVFAESVHPHSLAVIGGALGWLESGQGRIHRLAPDGQSIVVAELKGYLRGQASLDDDLYVASSAHRVRSRSTGTPNALPGDPEAARSWLYHLRLSTGAITRCQLTQWGPEIYDLLVVPEGSLAGRPSVDRWSACVDRLWQLEEDVSRLRSMVAELYARPRGPEPPAPAVGPALSAEAQLASVQPTRADQDPAVEVLHREVSELRGQLVDARRERDQAREALSRMERSKIWRLGQAYWRLRAWVLRR